MKPIYSVFTGLLCLTAITAQAQTQLMDITYAAGQTVTVSGPTTISTGQAVTIASGANVTFQATQSITLNPGFNAQEGSTFAINPGSGVNQTDSDGDGMPDEWEILHGLNPLSAADAYTDLDGDGLINLEEYQLGYDPHVFDSYVRPAGWPNQGINVNVAVGTTAGELNVDKSGAATYSIPLWVSPGTSGMQPQLSLNYSSQAGSGIAGFGWSLSGVSMITRGPPSKVIDEKIQPITYTSDDAYYLDGQRLIVVSGTNGSADSEYRTQMESFTKVVAHGVAGLHGPEWFEAWTKAGLRIEFGNVTNSRIDGERRNTDPQSLGSPGALSWAVTKITDTAGNYMQFNYGWDSAHREQTLTSIVYTGNTAAGLAPYATVSFTYEDRPDKRLGFLLNTRSETTKRLQKIEASGLSGVARTYSLTYEQQPLSGWSLLASLTETGADGKSYPALTFDYSKHDSSNMGWENLADDGFVPPRSLSSDWNTGAGFVDLDGDGRPDYVVKREWSGGSPAVEANGIWLNTVDGFVQQSEFSAWQLPRAIGRDEDGDRGFRFMDINRDGRVDFVGGRSDNLGVWLNNGAGWTQAGYNFPEALSDAGSTHGQLADVDGDGLPDVVVSWMQQTGQHFPNNQVHRHGVYWNNGNGWSTTLDTSWTLPIFDQGTILIDLNGDGLPDVLQGRAHENGTWDKRGAWLNTRTAWVDAPQFYPKVPTTRDKYPMWGVEMADVNGDGLVDQVANHWDGVVEVKQTWLNTGDGWYRKETFDAPLALAINNSSNASGNLKAGTALIDLTQDGLLSQIVSRSMTVNGARVTDSRLFFGRSTGFLGVDTLSNTGLAAPGTYLAYDKESPISSQFVDLDADGAPDLVWNIEDGTMPAGFSRVGALRNTTPRPNLLKKVTNGLGVEVAIDYAPLTQRDAAGNFTVYTKGTGDAGQAGAINAIGPMYVVKTINNDDGVGGQYAVNYTYTGLRTHPVYGSLGFEQMVVTDSRTATRSETTYSQVYPLVGMPIAAKTIATYTVPPSTTPIVVTLKDSVSEYGVKTFAGKPDKIKFVYASSTTEISKDLNNTVTGTVTTTLTDPDNTIDAYGNIKQLTVDTSGYVKVTTNTYDNNETTWQLGRLRTATVTTTPPSGAGSAITRKSAFTYDATTGLLKTETVEPDDAKLTLTTTYGYDSYGNKTSVTVSGANISVDTNGTVTATGSTSRATSTAYDVRGRFPISTTNAKTQTEHYTAYDQNLGVLTAMTGANGLATSWLYDGFGRKIQENRADGTHSNTYYRWVYQAPAEAKYLLGEFVPQAKYQVETISTGSAPSLAFYDSFGRAFLGLGVNGDGKIVYQTTQYDSQGRAFAKSTPYFGTGTAYWTRTTSFDVLNRPETTITPDDVHGDQTTTTSYAGLTATVQDPKGRISETTRNAQGWTISNIRNKQTDTSVADYSAVTYEYDAIGNLTKTTAAGVETTLAYDLRGRKTSMTDADMGTWKYRYNIFGELIWQKDNNSQIVTMTYDDLGRMITRTEAEGTTTWTYDTSPNHGIGKLHTVNTPTTYAETYSYDSLGRPSSIIRSLNSTDYEFQTTYDSSGRPLKTTYPVTGVGSNRLATGSIYNAYGYLKEIRAWAAGNTSIPTGQLYWRADHYSASGRLDGESYGNGLANDRVYSDVTGRLIRATIDAGTVTSGPFGVQDLNYTYDQVGNVTRRYDNATGFVRDEYFSDTSGSNGYDGLDRLKVHRISGGATVNVTYNQLGNITAKSDVGAYGYTGPRPHAVASAGTHTYTYDANGNMLTDVVAGTAVREHGWTSFNQLKWVKAGNLSSEFAFGAGHERVQQIRRTGATLSGGNLTGGTVTDTTIYVGSLYEKVTTTAGNVVEHKHYIMAPTGRIAVVTESTANNLPQAGTTRYFHTDGLGSITVVSDEAGRVLKRYAYDAWGKQSTLYTNTSSGLTNQAPTTRGFTDHEMLSDFGLIHMNGRVYDQTLGRFISADPNVDGVSDAQGFNRYSYVGNNPLGATDPTGFFSLKDVLPAIIGIVVAAIVIVALQPGAMPALKGFFAALKGALVKGGWAAVGAGAAGGGASGFSGSLLNGGSLGDAFKAGVIGAAVGAATAWAAGQIGDFFNGLDGMWADEMFSNWAGRTIAHGALGGLVTEAQGGQFRHGFYSSAASAGVMHIRGVARFMGGDKGGAWIAARTATAAVIGGTASELSGGKFANGAITSAFQQMFNAEATRALASQQSIFQGRMIVFSGTSGVKDAKEAFPDAKIVPVSSATTFSEAIKSTDLTGYDRVVIVAESNGQELWFGSKAGYTAAISLGSSGTGAGSAGFSLLANKMGTGSALTLIACNSGKHLAPLLVSQYGITVYAPEEKVGFGFELSTRKTIQGAVYNEDANLATFYKYSK